MPRVRRKSKARSTERLSDFEVMRVGKLGGEFLRKYARYWPAHGEEWTRMQGHDHPGTRPSLFWELDHPELMGEVAELGETETLRRHGLLTDYEIASFERRERFAQKGSDTDE